MRSQTSLRDINGIKLNRAIAFAPSIMQTDAHESRSERYAHISTLDVLLKLELEGFKITHIDKQRVRDMSKRGYEKHQLRLSHVNAFQHSSDQLVPQILLTNSHDGASAFIIRAGVYRFVCSNGLVIAEGGECKQSIRHSGNNTLDSVIEGTYEVLERAKQGMHSLQEWDGIKLEAPEREAFAEAALVAHYGDAEHVPLAPSQLLQVRRNDDRKPSLHNVFNVVQENLIKGNLLGKDVNNHSRRTRAVTGIDSGNKLNSALWTLAERMAELKTGSKIAA